MAGVTNVQMELAAVREAVTLVPPGGRATILTDSQCAIGWLQGLPPDGARGQEPLRKWKRKDAGVIQACAVIDRLMQERTITLARVAGHSGDAHNEACDVAAKAAAATYL